MINFEDAPYTYEYKDYFKILPTLNNWCSDPERINSGVLVDENFIYSSNLNKEWMTKEELRFWIDNQIKQKKILSDEH